MILDTCALLWLAGKEKRLSRSAMTQIEEAPAVYVSAISGFEIALKCAKGKLQLPKPPHDWFEEVIGHHGFIVLPLEWAVCIAAAGLPGIHADPCDRFIIATAKLNDLPVITADSRFAEYGVEVLT